MSNDTIDFQETVTLSREGKSREGKPFEALEENGIPKALRGAQAYANKDGFVFTAPNLVEQRIKHSDLEHPFWKGYTLLTEETRIKNYHLILITMEHPLIIAKLLHRLILLFHI